MPEIKRKLEALRDSISITDASLEPVRDMLSLSAAAANGSTDKLQAISEAVAAQGYVIGQMAVVEKTCPMRGPVVGKLAVVYPFRWPLAVVASVAMIVLGSDRLWQLLSDQRVKEACAQYEPGN